MGDVGRYVWKQSLGGGGVYVTGMVQDPVSPDRLYARSDVGGVFLSEDGGVTWRASNRGMAACHHHSVQAICINPHDPSVLFRGSGEARGGHVFGDIHKSIDHGDSWYRVTGDVDFYGNGPTRMYGETISFSPFDPAFVAAGGYSSGVWVSRDEGETWRYSGLRGERIGFVAFHPYEADLLYVSTISDPDLDGSPREEPGIAGYLKALGDTERGPASSLYLSRDRGASWERVHQSHDYSIAELAFDPADPERLLAAGLWAGILESRDGGRTFTPLNEGLPQGLRYQTVAADPREPGVFYTAPDLRPTHRDLPPIPVYRTAEDGCCWELIRHHGLHDLSEVPHQIAIPEHLGWAIAKVRVDAASSDRLYIMNWRAVSLSRDRGQTWENHFDKGVEGDCAEAILNDPRTDGKFYFSMADHQPCVSLDGGRRFRQFHHDSRFNASSAITVSVHRSGLLLYGGVDREKRRHCLFRSEDDGETVETVPGFREELFPQALAEDPHHPGTFYLIMEGRMEEGAGLYRSEDWGKNWRLVEGVYPSHLQSLPEAPHWIEAELLSVVVYQVKNACGSNRFLCVDPHAAGAVYVGEWTSGIFATRDGGATWDDTSKGLPFGRDPASVLSCLALDPHRQYVLYAGFIREGLWRSENGGRSWSKIFPLREQVMNVSAMTIGAPGKGDILIACEPLYWSHSPSAVYQSLDRGETWHRIYKGEHGALRWKGIAADPKTGAIVGTTCGNGCYYAELVH